MNTTIRTSIAERLGRAFGRGWRAYGARGERRRSNWLVCPRRCRELARSCACGWSSWLRFGLLFYARSGSPLVLLIGVAVTWISSNLDHP